MSEEKAQGQVVEMTEQPKPKYTLKDLDRDIMALLSINSEVIKTNRAKIGELIGEPVNQQLIDINSKLHELVAIVTKHVNDLEPIDMPTVSNELIQTTINTEKPVMQVCGVQLIENGRLVGTSLYSTVVKARSIRDILNKKFAELKVNHEAKIVNYPVF